MISHIIFCLISLIFELKSASSQLEKVLVPKEEFALSLWLISRTGWVYCERAGAYMDEMQQRFDQVKCKKCYFNLFDKYKEAPQNVTDADILKCSRNFGASLIPSMPSFSRRDGQSLQSSFPFGFFRQINPLETVGVQAFTCNSEVSKEATLSLDRMILPTVASMFQLFSTREFSSTNDPKRQFPRKSYVDCLFGKLFETEMALCPINAARRRCALKGREADEEQIFSTNIPIGYNFQ